MKEGLVLHYLNLRIIQSDLGISVDQSEHISNLVKDWYPNRFKDTHTPLRTDSNFEIELSEKPPPTPQELLGLKDLYNFKYRTHLGQLQHISTWSCAYLSYACSKMASNNMNQNNVTFYGVKLTSLYFATHPNNPLMYPRQHHTDTNIFKLSFSARDIDILPFPTK